MTDIKLRPSQEAVMAYEGGKMGIAAVPGAGKTFTLSHLAAKLVEELADQGLEYEQEVLIVTFTNPAVNTFRSRIGILLEQERGLFRSIGYRVRTLHGLAHDIVRMRPGLVGLAEGFEIVDERITNNIIKDLAISWMRTHSEHLIHYVALEHAQDEGKLRHIVRKNGANMIESIGREVVRLGKDRQWEPDEMRDRLDDLGMPLILAEIGIGFYADYQRALSYRGAVDFDDLVRLAMDALDADESFLERLQGQWPYILEDEAQDSSELQNKLLKKLSGDKNWVRVGDTNQSIYTTFTTANSNFLRQFILEADTVEQNLDVSGRSEAGIIQLANYLVDWISTDENVAQLNQTFYPLKIRPTDPGDPQENPTDGNIHIAWNPEKNITPEREIEMVVNSIEKWLPSHEEWTVAVLAPENTRGYKVTEALKERGIEYEELLRSTTATRDAAKQLQLVFDFLADPTSGRALGRLYHDVWWAIENKDNESIEKDEAAQEIRHQITQQFNRLKTTEDFLWPNADSEWGISGEVDFDDLTAKFRQRARIWLEASILPVDQLILTISLDLFTAQTDLALAHKIAVVMRGIAGNNPDYRLPELRQELRMIADNQRRFLGFDGAASGYEAKKGVVTVSTMHAAKGLEWDRVYLMALNNYSFPAAQPGDSFISERWFVRDNLNIQAESHAQVDRLMAGDPHGYVEGEASAQARIDYSSERLRLLYVGITRARRDLIITWNMGRFWQQGRRNTGAAALIALADYWKRELKS